VGIPSDLDSVFVHANTAHQPVLSSFVNVTELTIDPDARLDLSGYGITVHGSIQADGAIFNVGSTTTDGANAVVRGNFSDLQILAAGVHADGAMTVTGTMFVGGGGDFAPAGNSIDVYGDFSAFGGTLSLTGSSDELVVGGNAVFGNNDETGKLSSGELYIAGNLTLACYNNTEFVATGVRVNMFGNAPQTISMCSSGVSQLWDLWIVGGATVSTGDNPLRIAVALNVDGTFNINAGALVDVAGSAGSVTINGGGILNNNGTLTANLPITNFGTLNGNPPVQR
jgi:hypothetical protein